MSWLFRAAVTLAMSSGIVFGGDVRFELTLKDGKTHFRSGEPILLQLSFTSDKPGFTINTTVTEPASPVDTVTLEPAEGAYPWMEQQARGHRYSPDYASMAELPLNKPIKLTLALNDLYRFDQAGHFSVHVVTQRLHLNDTSWTAAQELTSNSIAFDVTPFPEPEEAERAAAFEQRIREAKNQREAQSLADDLDYLPGDAATRVKLSLYLHPKEFYPFGIDVTRGLWIARNRAMVIKAIEKAIVDPAQKNGAGSGMLNTLVALKESMEEPYDAQHEPRNAMLGQITAGYVHQIALTIPKRTGESQIDAARTVLVEMVRAGQTSGPDFDLAREVLITHFGDVNEYNVDWMLNPNGYGKYFRDPRMIPVLRQILENTTDPLFTTNRAAALSQFAAIGDPEELPKYVVREACAASPVMMQTIRDLTTRQTIPEVDACLGEKLRHETEKGGDRHKLGSTMQYIARFADAALIPDVHTAYAAKTDDWDQSARGAAITYLMRWDAANSRPLLDEIMPGRDPYGGAMSFSLLDAAYAPADGLREAFRDQLRTAPAKDAGFSAYALSQVGEPEDRDFLREQLARLRILHPAGFSTDEGNLEMELVSAILRGTKWESTPEETATLVASCISEGCKQRFQNH